MTRSSLARVPSSRRRWRVGLALALAAALAIALLPLQRAEAEVADVTAIVECGFATWASDKVDETMRARFDGERIPVSGVRHVRIWGIQVDDERELPGRERTQIPDEEIWDAHVVHAEEGSMGRSEELVVPSSSAQATRPGRIGCRSFLRFDGAQNHHNTAAAQQQQQRDDHIDHQTAPRAAIRYRNRSDRFARI